VKEEELTTHQFSSLSLSHQQNAQQNGQPHQQQPPPPPPPQQPNNFQEPAPRLQRRSLNIQRPESPIYNRPNIPESPLSDPVNLANLDSKCRECGKQVNLYKLPCCQRYICSSCVQQYHSEVGGRRDQIQCICGDTDKYKNLHKYIIDINGVQLVYTDVNNTGEYQSKQLANLIPHIRTYITECQEFIKKNNNPRTQTKRMVGSRQTNENTLNNMVIKEQNIISKLQTEIDNELIEMNGAISKIENNLGYIGERNAHILRVRDHQSRLNNVIGY